MAHVDEIRSIDELASLRLVWHALLAETPSPSFFLSLDWLTTYWRHFGRDQQLRVLICQAAGRPIGIVPLVLRREQTRLGTLRVLTYPLHDWGSYYRPIGRDQTATLNLALDYLARRHCDWDLLDLRWIDSAVDRQRTERAFRRAGLQSRQGDWKQFAVARVTGGWQEYLSTRTSKFRRNVRRLLRRAEESGLRFVRHRPDPLTMGDGEPDWPRYDACVELARRSWQGSSASGTTISHDGVAAHFREAYAAACRAGAADLCTLQRDADVLAFGYNFHTAGYVTGLRMGYDPEESDLSPGLVLIAHMLRDSAERGDHTFDFGPGTLEIKRRWLTDVAASCRVTHYAARPKAQLLRLKHWATGSGRECRGEGVKG